MTTLSENVFDALASHSSKGLKKNSKVESMENGEEKEEKEDADPLAITNPDSVSIDESSWIVQASGKDKRRLAPSHSLSKNDIGVESPKAKVSTLEPVKKKGTPNNP